MTEQRFSVLDVPRNPARSAEEEEFRVLLVSDSHIGAGYGTWGTETSHVFRCGKNLRFTAGRCVTLPDGSTVTFEKDTVLSLPDDSRVIFRNGITTWERALLLTDCIIKEWEYCHPDCVILLGDIVSNEASQTYNNTGSPAYHTFPAHFWTDFKNCYCSRLDDRGIPWYFVYANHDDLTDDDFAHFFPYSKNFVLRLCGGKTILLGMDKFSDPVQSPEMRKWGFGNPSDADPDFLSFCASYADHSRETILLPHHLSDDALSARVLAFADEHPRVLCAVCGHTHYCEDSILKTPSEKAFHAYHIGHFSWAAEEWELCSDETISARNLAGDPRSPGPFGMAYLVGSPESIRLYQIYPEIEYGKTRGSGGRYVTAADFDAFYQPRFSTEQTVHRGNHKIR